MGRDLKQYARQTNLRLAAGFLLLLMVVGDGLIYLFYGRSAAVMGLLCILAGLVPVAMVLIALWLIDRIVKASQLD
jgi:Zn-dependent protease with chaperone function